MSYCYYLEYESGVSMFGTEHYHCKLSGKTFTPSEYSADERQVKYTCKQDCEHCEIYRNR